MRCEHAGEMLSARLDDRLTGVERRALDAHLALCAACRREWEALASVHRAFSGAPAIQAPSSVVLGTLARIQRRQRVRGAIYGGGALLLGTIVLALVMLTPLLTAALNAGSLISVWLAGGGSALGNVVSLLATTARAGSALLRAFAVPVAVCAVLLGVFVAVTNGLWIGALIRLRPNR